MANKQLRILELSPFYAPNVGGVETHLVDLMSWLQPRVKQLWVITYQSLVGVSRGRAVEHQGNLTIRRLSWPANWYYWTLKWPIIHFLYLFPGIFGYSWWWLNRHRSEVDLIHAHGLNGGLAGALLARLFGIPLVISMHVEFHFSTESFSSQFYIWILKQADRVLVLTENGRQALIKFGLNPAKLAVYAYWVDQQRFKPAAQIKCRDQLGWSKDNFEVLFVGRLTPEKGVLEVVELARRLPRVNFSIIGNGQLATVISQLATELINLRFVGLIDNQSLPTYYSAADVLIVPSRVVRPRPVFEEGVPRVMIEALSTGLPVIGTDNGGVKEVIETGRVGWVVESQVKVMEKLISELAADPTKLNQARKLARIYAQQRFGIQAAEVILNSYQNL